MRIYILAKELGVSWKDIAKRLAKKGVSVKNHLSSLAEEEKQLAISLFNKPAKTAKRPLKKRTSSRVKTKTKKNRIIA